MADLPVYQYQGARIAPTASPVGSLLDNVQALQAGLETGTKIPSTAGAIANGIVSAVDTYSKLAYQDAQTQNVKADAAINQAKAAQILDGSPSAKDQAEIDYKNEQTAQLKTKAQAQSDFQSLSDTIANGTPQEIAGLLSDPGAVSTLLKNYKDAPTALGMMRSRLGDDPEATKQLDLLGQNIRSFSAASQKADVDTLAKNAMVKSGIEATGKMLSSGILQQIDPEAAASNPNSIYQNYTAYPKGLKQKDSGFIDANGTDNPLAQSHGAYDIFRNSDGKYVTTLEDKDQASLFIKGKTGYQAQIGDIAKASGVNSDVTSQTDTQETPSIQVAKPDANAINSNIKPPQSQIGNASTTQGLIDQRKAYWQKRSQELGGTPIADTIPAPTGPNPVNTDIATPKVYKAPTPSEGLSKASPTPLALKTDTSYQVKDDVYGSINANPYLSNEPAYIKGLAAIESGGKVDAVSPTGVGGLLQVTQATAKHYGFDRNDPAQNVQAGKAFFTDMITNPDYFGKGTSNPILGNPTLAFAGYSALGPYGVKHAVEATGSTDWKVLKEYLRGYVSKDIFKQVENYPDRALNASSQFINPNNVQDQGFLSALSFNGLVTPV